MSDRDSNGRQIYTIGHSNHAIERLGELLRRHGVTAVADVRSTPYSRFNPQFNRETLAGWFTEVGIRYVFLGRELGGRSEDPADYDEHGVVSYGRLRAKPTFEAGIERLLRGAATQRIALLCSEKEPLDCHRTLLVARDLADRGIPVQHIHADGSLESHDQTMDRLLEERGLKQTTLFASAPGKAGSEGDPISRAIALKAAEVAFRPGRPR